MEKLNLKRDWTEFCCYSYPKTIPPLPPHPLFNVQTKLYPYGCSCDRKILFLKLLLNSSGAYWNNLLKCLLAVPLNGNHAPMGSPWCCLSVFVCVCSPVNCLRHRWSGPISWRRSSVTMTLSCRSGEKLLSRLWCCWTRYSDTKRGLHGLKPWEFFSALNTNVTQYSDWQYRSWQVKLPPSSNTSEPGL